MSGGGQLSDKDVRRFVQARRWFFASSRNDGPAHIASETHISLCGSPIDTRAQRSAKKMCQHCKRKMIGVIEAERAQHPGAETGAG